MIPMTLNQIKSKIARDQSRKIKFKERLNILNDELKSIIRNELSVMFAPETFDDMKNYIDASNNLAKRICSEISLVYNDEPVRRVTPKSHDKRYQEIVTQMRLDAKMQRVNYYLNGLNDLILMPAIYGTPTQMTNEGVIFNNRMDMNILTPDRVTVFEDEDDPTTIKALAIEDRFFDESGKEITLYYYWSPLEHYILNSEFQKQYVLGNEQGLNPYWEYNQEGAFYPFIPIHNSERISSFWDESSGSDLFEATKSLAIKNTFIYFMFPMQFKQMAIQTDTIDANQPSVKNPQVKSPLHVIQTNGQTQVLDWQSQLEQLKNLVESQLYQVGSAYGISAENFKLTATETSGFARMISKERLLEIRKSQVKNYRNIEQAIFEASAIANNLYSLGNEITDSAKLTVDFIDPDFPSPPIEELAVVEKKMSLGLTNILEVIKSENPDIKTDEEAEEVLEKNLEVRNRIQSKFSGLFQGFKFENKESGGDNADDND